MNTNVEPGIVLHRKDGTEMKFISTNRDYIIMRYQ